MFHFSRGSQNLCSSRRAKTAAKASNGKPEKQLSLYIRCTLLDSWLNSIRYAVFPPQFIARLESLGLGNHRAIAGNFWIAYWTSSEIVKYSRRKNARGLHFSKNSRLYTHNIFWIARTHRSPQFYPNFIRPSPMLFDHGSSKVHFQPQTIRKFCDDHKS